MIAKATFSDYKPGAPLCWSHLPRCMCCDVAFPFIHPSEYVFVTEEQILNPNVIFLLTDQLERVFLRLGHAETDDQLQDIISKFLPPVLLKLSSVQEGVRKKVTHMNVLCGILQH